MEILDQFGRPLTYSRTFAHGADNSRLRGPSYDIRDTDIDKLIPSNDRRTLVALSKRLFTNLGVPKAIVTQKADYSVGEAWIPSYTGPGEGTEAELWLRNVWMPNCDVRGGIFDWNQMLLGVSADIDFGDSFTLKTFTADESFPLLQNIASHRVQNGRDSKTVKGGRYDGADICDGIIYNSERRPIAYRVRREGEKDAWDDIPAASIIHVFDPDFANQGRGLPVFSHAIEDLKCCLQSTEWERIRQLIISSIGLIEYNERGGPDMDDPANLGRSGTDTGVTFESFQGGMIRYMKANSGAKLEAVKHENPGPIWDAFQDRMIRMCTIGASWSYSMIWKATGQGTAERADVLRARRAVMKRQRLLGYFARQAVTYAVGYAQDRRRITRANGSAVFVPNPTRWGFSRPPRLTVDDGREDKSLMEGWRAGTRNLTEVVEANGRSIEEFTEERAREVGLRKVVALRVAEEISKLTGYKITIEDREMAMLTANEQSKTDPAEDQQTEPEEEAE